MEGYNLLKYQKDYMLVTQGNSLTSTTRVDIVMLF